MHLVLFFTRGVSLQTWASVGSLEREIALYLRLGEKGVHVTFITYGGSGDLQYASQHDGIEILCNRWNLPPRWYERLLPFLHARILRSADVIKTNQTNGADVALRAARIWRKPLIARCGYMWSEFAQRRGATNEVELARKMRWLRDHGSSQKYVHPMSRGWNSRLDSFQAVVLSAKLKKLDQWNELRRQAAAHYREALADLPIALPLEPDYAKHIYHLYVIRHSERDRLQKELAARNIHSGLHYPIPLHRQEAYQFLSLSEGSYPNAEESARTLLSLPMHQALTLDQIERVRDALAEIL